MTASHVPERAGPVTPENDNAPWQARVGENGEADGEQCATLPAGAQIERKREATLTALLALRGHEVHRLECGGEFVVVWRNCAKHCRDLAELEAHARRVGALR